MEAEPQQGLTLLLGRARAGDERARGELVALVYDELRRVAARLMRRGPHISLREDRHPETAMGRSVNRRSARTVAFTPGRARPRSSRRSSGGRSPAAGPPARRP
ncbi:MAG TPA: ECF-type sigma factor [Isosphaeraceae bacterium]|nr:ECF-type sigma factor [Isosphaeraceae bacterium]